jgi:polyisoprenoid-binding protein YceI
MKITVKLLQLMLPLLLVSSALGQHQTFTITPESSDVSFTLGDVLHTVHGSFHVQSSSVDFDRSAGTIAGSVVVAAGSGNSGSEARDRKMSTEILDASHFAEVSFVPATYQGTIAQTGDSAIQVTGTFTLHGKPHPLTVPMQIHIDETNCTAKTHFSVPYVQWGLKDPSTFILRVGKVVDIDLTLVGHLTSPH